MQNAEIVLQAMWKLGSNGQPLERVYRQLFNEKLYLAAYAKLSKNEGALTKGTLEDDTIDKYNQFLLICRDNGDSISMKIFEDIIDEEQIHYNYFDNVDGHIKQLGDTFLAKIAGTPSSTGLGKSGFAVGGEE